MDVALSDEPLVAGVESNALHFLEEAAKQASSGIENGYLSSSKIVKRGDELDLDLKQSLASTIGTTKSAASVLKSIDAKYLKSISKTALKVFPDLTAERFEKELEHQLARAEKGMKFSSDSEREEALENLQEVRRVFETMGSKADATLGIQHVYDPETQRGYSTVMIMKAHSAGDGVSKHLVMGQGSVSYEYKGSKMCFKSIEMDSAADAMNKIDLELAAYASISEEIKRLKPHRTKWEVTKEVGPNVATFATNAICAIIAALQPLKPSTPPITLA